MSSKKKNQGKVLRIKDLSELGQLREEFGEALVPESEETTVEGTQEALEGTQEAPVKTEVEVQEVVNPTPVGKIDLKSIMRGGSITPPAPKEDRPLRPEKEVNSGPFKGYIVEENNVEFRVSGQIDESPQIYGVNKATGIPPTIGKLSMGDHVEYYVSKVPNPDTKGGKKRMMFVASVMNKLENPNKERVEALLTEISEFSSPEELIKISSMRMNALVLGLVEKLTEDELELASCVSDILDLSGYTIVHVQPNGLWMLKKNKN